MLTYFITNHNSENFPLVFSSSVLIGVAGSLLLDNVDWGSAFYCIGIAGITWLIIWKVTLLRNSDLKHSNDVQESPSNSNKPFSVPWLSVLSHCPLWYVFVSGTYNCMVDGRVKGGGGGGIRVKHKATSLGLEFPLNFCTCTYTI